MRLNGLACLIALQLIQLIQATTSDDLYELLGISRKATTREIRQAFKKIALLKHPDKNKHEANANENFIKINRAYEILKDDELRKKYDQFGEAGLKEDFSRGQQYQSWNFYKNSFGIYDNDVEIVTLSRSDFQQTVDGSASLWFINFYSSQCSHCHDLAPVWRELAKQLDGVVRIGAVNCMDDWLLCNEQQIHAFPSLVMYPQRAHYQGDRSLDSLLAYVMSLAKGNFIDLTHASLNAESKLWFISFSLHAKSYDDECLDDMILRKLSIMLNRFINIGKIDCKLERRLCESLKPTSTNMFYQYLDENSEKYSIDGLNYKDIASNLLKFIPDIPLLDSILFNKALDELKNKKAKAWLVQFVSESSINADLDLRKLPFLLDDIKIGRVECKKLLELCNQYKLVKYPTFILFKRKSLYEYYYGNKINAEDLAVFANENAFTNMKSLGQSDFPHVLEQSKPIFIDFFAPWCPPCMQLLPIFRRTAKKAGKLVNFGTVDCTIYQDVCSLYSITSYPTTILFNGTSSQQRYHGQHRVDDLVDFIDDFLNPVVHTLDYDKFHQLVDKKEIGKMWLIDWYASWCGPCQQLAPEWRKLAKKLVNQALVGQVDCVVEQRLCNEQQIQAYPHIRLYASTTYGSRDYIVYNPNMWRDVNSLYQWASGFLPSKAQMLTSKLFEEKVLKTSDVWLIDFYAPWCGHCQVFAPIFESIASRLEGKVKCGKFNCQDYPDVCQRAQIRGYPTISLYHGNNKHWHGDEIQSQDMNVILNDVKLKLRFRDEL